MKDMILCELRPNLKTGYSSKIVLLLGSLNVPSLCRTDFSTFSSGRTNILPLFAEDKFGLSLVTNVMTSCW